MSDPMTSEKQVSLVGAGNCVDNSVENEEKYIY